MSLNEKTHSWKSVVRIDILSLDLFEGRRMRSDGDSSGVVDNDFALLRKPLAALQPSEFYREADNGYFVIRKSLEVLVAELVTALAHGRHLQVHKMSACDTAVNIAAAAVVHEPGNGAAELPRDKKKTDRRA